MLDKTGAFVLRDIGRDKLEYRGVGARSGVRPTV